MGSHISRWNNNPMRKIVLRLPVASISSVPGSVRNGLF
jgi:hypothetical protein